MSHPLNVTDGLTFDELNIPRKESYTTKALKIVVIAKENNGKM
jgi:hypothetical protein